VTDHTIPTPLDRIETLETRFDEVEQAWKKPRDPVSPRMLALVTISMLMIAVVALGAMKILTIEVCGTILGAVAGRLTSNIGGGNENSNGASKSS
jgi:hypothetical protein